MMTSPQYLLVLLIGFIRELVHAFGNHQGLPVGIPALMANFYTRYDAYPPYCSVPLEMTKRSIPTLRPNIHLGDSRLTHVTAVIRHGARTPWSGSEKCWDGYWDPGADTATWDCELTTFLSPPSPRVVDVEEGIYASESDAMFLFEKKYDALSAPQSNELHGTCQIGQLLLQGHDQELANGQHLRDAYVYDGSTMKHDIKLRLLDLSNTKSRPYESPVLKYRADDDQRTLMSGQILLRGMFGTEFVEHIKKNGQHAIIPLHVADRSKDILDANAAECPRLTELEAAAKESKEFKAFNNTVESKIMNSFISNEMQSSDSPLDCLMTTICTDRTLPEALNDYKGHGRELPKEYNPTIAHDVSDVPNRNLHKSDDDNDYVHGNYGTNLFERVAKFDIERSVFPYLYNGAEYSKVAMAPLWAEIMEEIVPITSGGDDRNALSSNKMHVISGHDTTIIPLMASIGAWKVDEWPAYASMMLIEVHELVDGKTDRSVYPSRFAFRLIYNGEVFTDRVPGCQKEHDLCDFDVLKTIVDSFGGRDRNCALLSKSSTVSKESGSSGGVFSFLLTVFISAALGALTATFYLKSFGSKYRTLDEDSDGIMMTNGGIRYRDEVGSDQQEEQDAPSMLII